MYSSFSCFKCCAMAKALLSVIWSFSIWPSIGYEVLAPLTQGAPRLGLSHPHRPPYSRQYPAKPDCVAPWQWPSRLFVQSYCNLPKLPKYPVGAKSAVVISWQFLRSPDPRYYSLLHRDKLVQRLSTCRLAILVIAWIPRCIILTFSELVVHDTAKNADEVRQRAYCRYSLITEKVIVDAEELQFVESISYGLCAVVCKSIIWDVQPSQVRQIVCDDISTPIPYTHSLCVECDSTDIKFLHNIEFHLQNRNMSHLPQCKFEPIRSDFIVTVQIQLN